MRFLSPILLACLLLFTLVGARTHWFQNGFGLREINQLERDWNQLLVWLNQPPLPEGPEWRLAHLRLEWKKSKFSECWFEVPEDQLISRAALSSAEDAFLRYFEELIARGQLDALPIVGPTAPIRQFARLELQMDDLTPERMEHFLTWTHNLQRGVSLSGKDLGVELGILALKRCQSDPQLMPWPQPLPPPC